MAAAVATRETIINLRAPAKQRALIDQAAQVLGKTRTDFMLEAAYEKAQQVLDIAMRAIGHRRADNDIVLTAEPAHQHRPAGQQGLVQAAAMTAGEA